MRKIYFISLVILLIIVGCQQNKIRPQNNEISDDTTPSGTEKPVETLIGSEPLSDSDKGNVISGELVLDGAEVMLLGRPGFEPDQVNIQTGSTVVWIVGDNSVHILTTINNAMFRSRRLNPGDKFQHTFDKAGTYEVIDTVFKKSMIVTVE